MSFTPPPIDDPSRTFETAKKRPHPEAAQMDDLIHRAKASRYAAPVHDDDADDEIEKQITCSICTELYVDPVIVLPCRHSFCGASVPAARAPPADLRPGSCAARWLETSCTCPACRGTVLDTTPNTAAEELVAMVLHASPDKARPAAELLELQALYQRGQKIIVYEPEPSDDDDEPDDPDFEWQPCPCCSSDNTRGFVCPAPIPAGGAHSAAAAFRGHARCTFCAREVPTGWLPHRCDVCADVSCGNMFPEEGCPERVDCVGWIARIQGWWRRPSPTQRQQKTKIIMTTGKKT